MNDPFKGGERYMKSLESGKDRIQSICDKLRKKTIEPAKEEAQKLLIEAKKHAESIKAEAEHHAVELIKQARGQIEQERSVFHSALQQASKQTLEGLRQEIENKLFNEELQQVLDTHMADSKVVAGLINAIVNAIEKEGLSTDIAAVIPKTVSPDDVVDLILESVQKRLQNKPLEIGHFAGGVQLRLIGKKMTLDLSDQALKELLANYVRKDFRKIIFS
jgi:V/A-type H+-transporting ATPase subunit E